MLKVVPSYEWVFETALYKQEVFQGPWTSISQQSLDTIEKVRRKRGNDFSEYQPDKEILTQP